jgi:hypothetical protein
VPLNFFGFLFLYAIWFSNHLVFVTAENMGKHKGLYYAFSNCMFEKMYPDNHTLKTVAWQEGDALGSGSL